MQGSNAHCPQHCSQVGSVYEVQLPTDVQKLLIRMATIATLGLNLGLRVTPLACVGLDGFVAELIFWMVVPVVFVMIILVATWARVVIHGRSRASRSAMGARASRTSVGASGASTATIWLVLQQAAPYALRLLFLLYPIVTRTAFQAFSCYHFDEGQPTSTSWLRVDVSIECGTAAHGRATTLGLTAIVMYPVGLILIFGGLLYRARFEITQYHADRLELKHVHRRPTPRADAIAFLRTFCGFRT